MSEIQIAIDGAEGATRSVQVTIGGFREPPIAFDLDCEPGSHFDRVIRSLETGLHATDDVEFVGAELWNALLPGPLTEKVRTAIDANDYTTIRLRIPPELQGLPWEAVWDRHLRFVGAHAKVCLVHEVPSTPVVPARAPKRTERLGILVVIPQGSGLDHQREWANLNAKVASLGNTVELVELRNCVTPDVLSDKLQERHWNIVHFIGHGRLQDNYVEVRLNDEQGGECWRHADAFSALFQGACVDACVLNFCHGGAAKDVRTLDRLAPALLDTGVRAVVAMRYAMPDTAANRFSQSFYHQLLRGSRPGRLAHAVQQARKVLLQNASRDETRTFITPVVHLIADDDQLFEIGTSPSRPPRVTTNAQAVDRPVPPKLIDAVRQRCCVLVVGTELVPPPLERRGGGTAGLRGLMERLEQLVGTENRGAPTPEELAQNLPPDVQLSRLAERLEAESMGEQLVQAVRDYFAQLEPSETHRLLASWGAPGLFCTHFDGLLELALPAESRSRVVRSLVESPEVSAIARSARDIPGQTDPLVVLVRGSISDPRSVVLTEHDHFALGERIDRMHPSISAVARCHGRRLLFLGTSPGDRVTRQLARKLLDADDRRAAESFFVSRRHSPGDEHFWKRYRVTFLREDTAEFVRALSAAKGTA